MVDPAKLSRSSVDVFIANGQEDAVGRQASRIREFVRAGGGLLIGSHTWYWTSIGKPLAAHPTNVLLVPLGLVVAPTGVQQDGAMHPTQPPTGMGHADIALDCLEAVCKRKKPAAACKIASDESLQAVMESLGTTGGLIRTDGAGAKFWSRLNQVRSLLHSSTSLHLRSAWLVARPRCSKAINPVLCGPCSCLAPASQLSSTHGMPPRLLHPSLPTVSQLSATFSSD